MPVARYGNTEKTFIVVTFEDGHSAEVPCDPNNAIYHKLIIDMKIPILPFQE